MTDERAYTYVATGTARLGNRWFERRWTTFLGTTIELRLKEVDFDWLTRHGAEFSLAVNGETREGPHLGAAEWSEECDQYAATLVCRYSQPGLEVIVRTGALHDGPGMFRSAQVMNSAREPVTISNVALEILPLRTEGAVVYTDGFAKESEALAWETTEETAAVVVKRRRGLFLGIDGGGRFELFAPDRERCALVLTEERVLAPGAVWEFPEAFVALFTGDVRLAAGGVLDEFNRLRAGRKALAARLEAGAAEKD